MLRRARDADRYEIDDVAERLALYDVSYPPALAQGDTQDDDDDLVERAATLLLVMPRNQPRATIEGLLSPNDPERGRRAVDALIESAFAMEDTAGRLRRIA